MDNNQHIITEDMFEQLKKMLVSNDEESINLAIGILHKRNKNDLQTEEYFEKIEIFLDSHNNAEYLSSYGLRKKIFELSLNGIDF